MIVLTTSTSNQVFKCIPRDAFDTLEITDEQTNVTTEVDIVSQAFDGYVTSVTAAFELIENHFYTLTLKQGSDIIFKDKVFCTDQNIVKFSVNNGQYTSNTTANTYIVYE